MTATLHALPAARLDSKVFGKPFAWSYSKLKNFETCGKRHLQIDLLRAWKEEDSESLTYGNQLHDAIAKRLKDRTPLPLGMGHLEEWARKIEAAAGSDPIHTELKLAIRRDFGACGYFDRPAWYRGIADALVVKGPVAIAFDWKTGRIVEDSVQLGLMAACIFAHQPQVQAVRTEFVWLKEDTTTRRDFRRSEMVTFWNELLPRVSALEAAFVAATEAAYPARRSGLCRLYCPVKACEHNGA